MREELSEGELVRALSGDDPLPNAWQVRGGVVERDRVAGVSGGRGKGEGKEGRGQRSEEDTCVSYEEEDTCVLCRQRGEKEEVKEDSLF